MLTTEPTPFPGTEKPAPIQIEGKGNTLEDRFRNEGFRDAFGVLWQYHHTRLTYFVRGRGLADDRADDLLQEIGIKLFRYLSGHVVEVFPATAFKITKDQIVDTWRSQDRQPEFSSLDDLITLSLEPCSEPNDDRQERWQALIALMTEHGITKDQQTAVVLHHLVGYTVAEVALITDSKHEAVKSRLRRAAQKIGSAQRGEAP